MSSEFFARESLAGRSRTSLASGVVALIGAGAAGNNIGQTMALEGVGEVRLVDFDVIESSNATRSPLFGKGVVSGGRSSWKAETLARAVHALSYAESPVIRYAVAQFEALGLGAFADAGVLVSAVDSLAVRARIADAARLLGRPLVEIGFGFPVGHISVYANAAAEDVCWRCNRPDVTIERASCSLYARKIAEEGKVPATQTLAAALSAMASEAVIQALHGRFPLDGRRFHLNVETGASDVVNLKRDPDCAGAHRRHDRIERLEVTIDAPMPEVLAAMGSVHPRPLLRLPGPFLREAPCALCGAPVVVNRPARKISEAPRCDACPVAPSEGTPVHVIDAVSGEDLLDDLTLRALGVAPRDVLEVEDRETGEIVAVQLAGSLDDLYTTIGSTSAASANNRT